MSAWQVKMKKVKLKEVAGKGWKIKKGDRSSLNTARAAASTSEAVDRMVQIAEINTEFINKIAEAADKLIAGIPPAPGPRQPPKIEVIVPRPDRKKLRFRFTPIRNVDGFIEYVDVEEL